MENPDKQYSEEELQCWLDSKLQQDATFRLCFEEAMQKGHQSLEEDLDANLGVHIDPEASFVSITIIKESNSTYLLSWGPEKND